MIEWKGDDIDPENVIEPETEEGDIEADLPAAAGAKIAKMREELAACRKDKQEYMDGWQRAKADYVNLLKRLETDAKASELKGKVRAVETLLPAFDALERAKDLPAGRQGTDELREGFMAIAKQLESAFASLGLEAVGQQGEKFDPALHEAFGQDAVDSLESDDTITVVLEKGWKVGTTIIRPAKVRVGHFKNN